MRGRLDEAEGMMGKLIQRVDTIFVDSPEQTSTKMRPMEEVEAVWNAGLDRHASLDAPSPRRASGAADAAPTLRAATPRHSALPQRSARSPVVAASCRARRASDLVAPIRPRCSPGPQFRATPKASAVGSSIASDPKTSASTAQVDLAALAAAAPLGEDGAEILQSWTGLLNENLRLQKQQQELLQRRKKYAEHAQRQRLTRSEGASPHSTGVLSSPAGGVSPSSSTLASPVHTYMRGTRPLHFGRGKDTLAPLPEV
mmetsp:Transcript_18156/g.49816  ORF Transcript_18156/g.49816 Transcript_18156/m.49816 type:complete len:257 (-) Transcript_18156:37-807(-)